MMHTYIHHPNDSVRAERWLVSALCIVAAVALLGCRTVPVEPADEVVKRSDELYRAYLAGDREQAKQSLLDTVHVIEKAKLKPWGQANMLFITYARLYALEFRTRSQSSAAGALVKARYWYLRENELSGDSQDEANAAVESFTPDKCIDYVDKWDRDHTGGKGPRYLRP